MTNPFPNPQSVDIKIKQEISTWIDDQLEATGKIMFYECMEAFEKAIETKDIHRAKIIAFYITDRLLKSSMPADERDFIIAGFIDQIKAIEENREPITIPRTPIIGVTDDKIRTKVRLMRTSETRTVGSCFGALRPFRRFAVPVNF